MPTLEQRRFVRDLVLAFMGRYPENRYLVTCRTLSYQPPPEGQPDLRLPQQVPVFELAPFDEARIDRFVVAWYSELTQVGTVRGEDQARLTQHLQAATRGGLKLPQAPVLMSVGAGLHNRQGQKVAMRANDIPKRVYPWGDEPDPERANYRDTQFYRTSVVGCFPLGASPYGCLDMAGNVWEWTLSLWGKDLFKPDFEYPYNPEDGREDLEADRTIYRALRGGAFYLNLNVVRCAARLRLSPSGRYLNLGFRCVVSPFTSDL